MVSGGRRLTCHLIEVFWAVSDEVGRLFGTELAAVGRFDAGRRPKANLVPVAPASGRLAGSRSGERVGGAEALAEDATEVEHKAQGEPRMGQSQSLEGRLRQHERLRRLERDDVRRAREAVEEPDLAEEVSGLEHADTLWASASRHEHLEGAARDDEEAAVDLAATDGELSGRVQPCLRVLEDEGLVGLVQVSEESALALAAPRSHSTRAAAPESITSWTTWYASCHADVYSGFQASPATCAIAPISTSPTTG